VRSLEIMPTPKEHNYMQKAAILNSKRPWSSTNVFTLFNKVLPHSGSTNAAGKPAVEPLETSLIKLLPHLVNVTEFTIEAFDLPPEFDPQPLLSAAWSAFGRNLHKLILKGHLEAIRAIIQSQPVLDALRGLYLELSYNVYNKEGRHDADILASVLAPFLNTWSSRIESLNITSWQTINLSPLFAKLQHFPYLHHFRMRAAFNMAFPEPDTLSAFLVSHSPTVESLVLRLNPARSFIENAGEKTLSEWLAATLPQSTFTSLRDLQIYPTVLDAGFDALLASIRVIPNPLTTFCIRDRYLHLDEITLLLDAFGQGAGTGGLRSLRLYVRTLTLELIDLLAAKAGRLTSLSLYVSNTDAVRIPFRACSKAHILQSRHF
jgi:hypothetical protein